jgi:hypothetical protein
MKKREFTIEYEFTSIEAHGGNYTRTRLVKAQDEQTALAVARIVGFSEFGARFNENCIDWRIAQTHWDEGE